MIKDVVYQKQTTFIGRNGCFKQSGLAITKYGDAISLEPLTSKGAIGHCQINIPYGNINDVMDALQQAMYQIENEK
jgi:hypothetical protein